jgi:hypothetical protein
VLVPGTARKAEGRAVLGSRTTLSARQTVDQPQAETEAEPSAPPSHLAAAPSEKAETTEAMPEKWRPAATDQLLAFTCCWPELEEPAPLPQLTPEGGRPPAWPLALLPLGLYALHTSPRRQCSTGLDASATSLFVLPIDEQQHIAIANLRDAPDPKPGAGVRSRLVTA